MLRLLVRSMNLLPNEAERLETLDKYKILDAAHETSFDDLARLAAEICETPIALVSMVDRDRQWFMAGVGFDADQTAFGASFCAHAIQSRELFVIEDARQDARFTENPLVTGKPFVRFYAGAPLVNTGGFALGTLCVMDSQPRRLSRVQTTALRVLASQLMRLLDASRAAAELAAANQRLVSEISEHAQTEKNLRQSQERFDLIMRATNDGIWDWNVQTNAVFFSPRWKTMLGYEPDELTDNIETFASRVHPDDWARVEHSLNRYFQDATDVYSEEIRMRCKDDSYKYVLARGVLTRDQTGAPARMTGTHVDLSELKQMATQLRESEIRYRQMFENTHTVKLLVEPESMRIVAANPAACEFYGYSLDRLRELTIENLNVAGSDKIRENISRILTEPRSRIISEHRLASGEIREIEINAVALTVGGNQLLYAAIYDMTEQRRAVEKIQASETRFRRLLENALDQITVADRNGIITYTSQSSLRVTGYAPETAVGQHLFAAVHREDLPKLHSELEKLLTKPGAVTANCEYRQRKSDGSWQIAESVAMNLLDDPAVAGIIVNTRDVTEKRNAEAELRRSEEQLRQLQKMEAVGQLAGGIAHDFNNIMTAVIGYSELALRKLPEDSKIRSNLNEIRSAGERAAALTQHLLAFSRKQVLQPQMIDLGELVGNLKQMLIRLIGEDIKLSTHSQARLGSVNADQSQIEQVVVNLIVNARDAIRERNNNNGQITIETSSHILDRHYAAKHVSVQPGEYVLLAVSDNGAGMNEATRRRAVEPFFTTKELGKGTGLGLSTVYGIVKQSGGNIWIYSEPNRGTTIKIYLPRFAQTADKPEPAPAKALTPGGSETILLVEDEAAVRLMTAEMLRSFGYQVVTAVNGSDALQIYERHSIDLLVTDLVMPQMGGKQLVAVIRARNPKLPVLLMSGYTSEAIVQQGRLPANAAFIAKPFAAEIFAGKVREILDQVAL